MTIQRNGGFILIPLNEGQVQRSITRGMVIWHASDFRPGGIDPVTRAQVAHVVEQEEAVAA